MTIGSKRHKKLVTTDAHSVIWQEVDDAAARMALVLAEEDNGKTVKQLDDDSLWYLVDYSGPTWKDLTATASANPLATQDEGVTVESDTQIANYTGAGVTVTPNGGNKVTVDIPGVGPTSGDVVGPGAATDDAIVVFDGTTGKLIKNSTGTIAQIQTNSLKETNATHTGDVTGDGALTIAINAVTLAKMAEQATQTILGRITAGTGIPEVLSALQVRSILNVEDGAEANAVDSVAGKTGIVTLDKTDVGLDNVDDTADADKPVSTATQTALDLKAADANVLHNNVAGEIDALTAKANPVGADTLAINDSESAGDLKSATLTDLIAGVAGDVKGPAGGTVDGDLSAFDDSTGKLLRKATVTEADVVANNAKETNATHTGEVTGDGILTIATSAVTTDKIAEDNVTFPKIEDIDSTTMLGRVTGGTGNVQALTPAQVRTNLNVEDGAEANTVDSVAGKTGVVTLAKADVGLGNADNTADADKPVSTATQTALDLKADDADVFHKATAGEIAALANKAAPHPGDYILINDSENADVVKQVLVGDLPASTGDVTGPAGGTIDGEISVFDDGTGKLLRKATVTEADVVANNAKISYVDAAKVAGIETGADVTDTTNVAAAGALMKTGGEMSGNITMAATETVDGRDVSVDGSKLDGVETAADVTDPTNVAAAGAVMDSDISEAEGMVRKTGAGAYEAIKTNLGAAVDPTVNEDSDDGYAVGSRWLNTTDDKEFVALDVTVGAAVWSETTASGAGDVVGPGSATDSAVALYDGTTGKLLKNSNTTEAKAAVGLANVENLKVNLVATTDPGTGDDSGSGYQAGSSWINTTDDKEFICLDATPAAAVWKETTATATGSVSGQGVGTWDFDSSTVDADPGAGKFRMNDADETLVTEIYLGLVNNEGADASVAFYDHGAVDGFVYIQRAEDSDEVLIYTTNLSPQSGGLYVTLRGLTFHSATSGWTGASTKKYAFVYNASPIDAGFLVRKNASQRPTTPGDMAVHSGSAGVEISNIKQNLAATVDPTVNDDLDSGGTDNGYTVGSRWFNTTADTAFVCLDSTVGAAVWKETTAGSGDVVGPVSATDDAIAVYDGTTGKLLKDSTPTAIRTLLNVEDGSTADQTGAEIKTAYEAEANAYTDTKNTKLTGIETAADVTDAANVAAAGAMMDSDISEGEGFLRKTGAGAYEAIKTNLGASVAPTADEDSGDGYAVGSRWIDTTADKEYVCLDATVAAAVWTETTQAGGVSSVSAGMGIFTFDSATTGAPAVGTWRLNNADPASATELVTDITPNDGGNATISGLLSEIGVNYELYINKIGQDESLVFSVTGLPSLAAGKYTIPIAHLSGSSSWTSSEEDCYFATPIPNRIRRDAYSNTAPTVGDDIDDGWEVGSRWTDDTASKDYVCVDSSSGAAVWLETTAAGDVVGPASSTDDGTALFDGTTGKLIKNRKNNNGASTNPTIESDAANGYAVGSRWINTTLDTEWVCLDATTDNAVWTETTQAGGGGAATYSTDRLLTYVTGTVLRQEFNPDTAYTHTCTDIQFHTQDDPAGAKSSYWEQLMALKPGDLIYARNAVYTDYQHCFRVTGYPTSSSIYRVTVPLTLQTDAEGHNGWTAGDGDWAFHFFPVHKRTYTHPVAHSSVCSDTTNWQGPSRTDYYAGAWNTDYGAKTGTPAYGASGYDATSILPLVPFDGVVREITMSYGTSGSTVEGELWLYKIEYTYDTYGSPTFTSIVKVCDVDGPTYNQEVHDVSQVLSSSNTVSAGDALILLFKASAGGGNGVNFKGTIVVEEA